MLIVMYLEKNNLEKISYQKNFFIYIGIVTEKSKPCIATNNFE